MTTNYHDPDTIQAGDPFALAPVKVWLADLDEGITDQAAAIADEAATRAAADGTLTTFVTNAGTAASAADAKAQTARDEVAAETTRATDAELTEQAARIANDGLEVVERSQAVASVQDQIDNLEAQAAATGGTATTVLLRTAGSTAIATIGGDGALLEVETDGDHDLIDGDYITVSGTDNYDGDYGPINVTATDAFEAATAINDAQETVGDVSSKRVFVADATQFAAGDLITITNDDGDLHPTTASAVDQGADTITLTDPVPLTWVSGARATSGAVVSKTLAEVALARDAMPGVDLPLPTLLRYGLGNRVVASAFTGATDGAKLNAAWTAAASIGGELFLERSYVLEGSDQLLFTGSNVKIGGNKAGKIVVDSAATATRALILRNCTDIDVSDIAMLCNKTGPMAALCIENSSRIKVQGMKIQLFPVYGIAISQNTTPVISSSAITFTSGTNTLSGAIGLFLDLTPGTVFLVQQSSYNNGMHTVVSKVADSSSIVVSETVTDEAAGQPVTIQIATACNDIMIEGNTVEDAQVIGIEGFPKVLSQNISVIDNTLRRCGIAAGNIVAAGGGAIKAGTMTRNAIIARNHIHDGGTGIAVGMWEITEIEHNVVQNCYGFGIAISASVHRHYGNGYAGVPSFSLLKILDNNMAVTPDFTPLASRAGININGLITTNGPIHVSGNSFNSWINGMTITNSLQELRHIRIRDNVFLDGGFAVVQLSATGAVVNGSNEITGVVATVGGGAPLGWTVGALIENATYLPVGTTITDIAATGATFTLSAAATSSGSAVSIVNLSGDVETRATLTSSSTTLSNVVNAEGWAVGDYIEAPGIPAGTKITAISYTTATFTISANATGTDAAAVLTSGLPRNLSLLNNEFTATIHEITGTTTSGNATVSSVSAADIARIRANMYVVGSNIPLNTTISSVGASSFVMSANATGNGSGVAIRAVQARKINLWSTGFRCKGNVIRAFGDYALDVKGGGLVEDNTFIDCDPMQIANRGAIFLRDALAYTVTGNTYDNASYGAVEYGINNTASSLLREGANVCAQPAIRAVLTSTSGFGAFTQTVGTTQSGRRVFTASAPPTALEGTYVVGDVVMNTGPTAAKGLSHWECITAGAGGTWRAYGSGTGNTAARPTLTTNDVGFQYYDTQTSQLLWWNGSSYVVI